MEIIKKKVGDNKKAWDSKIKYVLWADRITKKSATRKSPFELVYGLDVTLSVHLGFQCIIFFMVSIQKKMHFRT
jgi:hypothetical protein